MRRSVGSRVSVMCAGALLLATAASPVAAQQNDPGEQGLAAAVKKAAMAAAAESVAVSAAEPQAAPAAPAKPNTGNITLTSNLDVLAKTPYIYRGLVQESHPKLTLWPSGDLGIAVFSGGAGGLKAVNINTGIWNSLQTGSSGLDGPRARLHYEEDYYATLTLGFSGHINLATTYTAYTSPSLMFGTTHEILFKVSSATKYAPYIILAQELSGGGDAGPNKGTYVELGVGPSWPLAEGKATVAVPVKIGLSARNYYEHPVTGADSRFGFFDVGVLLTIPLSGVPAPFGSWNVHVGGDGLVFGETTRYFNSGGKAKGVFLFGIGLTY